MFYIVHVLLGALIGLHFNSLFLAVSTAFLSHFLLDMIPHWGLGFDKEYFRDYSKAKITRKIFFFGFFDAVLALFLIYFLYLRFNNLNVFFGCFASVLPDVLSLGYFTRIKKNRKYKGFLHFHNNIQREVGFLFGMVTQAVALLFLMLLIFR